MQPRPIARKLPPTATPVDAITAPPIVRILLIADIPNSPSPFVLVDDVPVSAKV